MWRCPEPGQRIPDVRSISPPQHRTDVGAVRHDGGDDGGSGAWPARRQPCRLTACPAEREAANISLTRPWSTPGGWPARSAYRAAKRRAQRPHRRQGVRVRLGARPDQAMLGQPARQLRGSAERVTPGSRESKLNRFAQFRGRVGVADQLARFGRFGDGRPHRERSGPRREGVLLMRCSGVDPSLPSRAAPRSRDDRRLARAAPGLLPIEPSAPTSLTPDARNAWPG